MRIESIKVHNFHICKLCTECINVQCFSQRVLHFSALVEKARLHSPDARLPSTIRYNSNLCMHVSCVYCYIIWCFRVLGVYSVLSVCIVLSVSSVLGVCNVLSVYSVCSVLGVGSVLSVYSVCSILGVCSVLSVYSVGSVLVVCSVLGVYSVLSVYSVCSVLRLDVNICTTLVFSVVSVHVV